MLKALFHKQWLEMTAGLFHNRKTGKARSKVSTVLYCCLYVFLFVILAVTFGGLSLLLAPTLAAYGLGWLYFAMMGLMGLLFGLFGSVFQTYASLYCAKDNDMLLSLPIPPKNILISRLFGVWIWAFAFEALVMVPASIVYWTLVSHSPLVILCCVLMILALPFFILALSCLLGYVIAKLASVLKGKKNIILAIVAIAGIAVYYYFCARAYEIIEAFLEQAVYYGQVIRENAGFVYFFGRAFDGGILDTLAIVAIIALVFVAMWYVMARSFIKLATIGNAKETVRRPATAQEKKSVLSSLVGKELKRFVSSATYMLNCGLGTVLLPIVGVVLLVKGSAIRATLVPLCAQVPILAPLISVGVCLLICSMTAMNDMSAPSISLEGKHIWIAQSLPIPTWKILWSKILMHLLLTVPVTLFASICAIIALRPSFSIAVFAIVLPLLFVLFTAIFGVAVNLKLPNLKWTNETVPVKQGLAVGLSLLGGMIVALLLGVGYFLLIWLIPAWLFPAWLYLTICSVIFLALSAGLSFWLYYRGTKIFASL